MKEYICKKKWIKKKWKDLDILIIDEISMMTPELFDKLEEVARLVLHSSKRFGNIQLILSGDFLQLPAIGTEKYCFDSDAWHNCIDHVVYLDNIIRQFLFIFNKLFF